MSENIHLQERLTDVEERLTNVESLLVSINQKLDWNARLSSDAQDNHNSEGSSTDNGTGSQARGDASTADSAASRRDLPVSMLADESDAPTADSAAALKQWVTDYVSMRLQQLVPETCEHPDEVPMHDGPFLDNTNVPCTEEVVHRVKRIPIPFVREMVVQRVAENARAAQIERVDIEFFEKAATF